MKEHNNRLSRPLIVGHGRDGRCLYDPEAKRELVDVCLQSGNSVAKVALAYGINANLLRKWINQYREHGCSAPRPPATLSAFAPVLPMAIPKSVDATFNVTLPNGIKLELQGVGLTDLAPLLNGLAALPCSASTPD